MTINLLLTTNLGHNIENIYYTQYSHNLEVDVCIITIYKSKQNVKYILHVLYT